jgi:hypothetical protein
MSVGLVRVNACDHVVNGHDSEQKDQEGTAVVVVQFHKSLPVHCYEQKVKGAHYQVYQDTAEMHSRIG